jgi:D-ornithine---citrate ligase
MSVALAGAGVGAAVEETDRALRRLDPDLHRRWSDALPRAADTVARRLVAAMQRERLGAVRLDGDAVTVPGGRVDAVRHGFDRAEPVGPLPAPALRLVADLVAPLGGSLAAELGSAVANLALGYARRATVDPFRLALGADERAAAFERLATEGHNLHPCGRTRLGWTPADVLAHDLEGGSTAVCFVGVRRDHLVGDDPGRALGQPGDGRHAAVPVHAWQLGHLRRTRPDLFAAGVLVDLDPAALPAVPTAALRTLYLPGHGYLKLSLDIQVTSTRRTISLASTRNGPALSNVLVRLLAGEPVLVLAETAGVGCAGAGADRDVSAIVRSGLSGRLRPGEVAVPAGALTAALPGGCGTVLAALLDRYPGDALAFVAEYARLLLPPLLRLATRYGIAFEAHLQNCLPVFRGGRPVRMAVRDFAGLRVLRPRLAARGVALPLWPGSAVGTDDPDVMRAKLGYTAFQAHLGELIRHLVTVAGLDEGAAWRAVRGVVDETYEDLRGEPGGAGDHAFWTAPAVPHKALLRMRLSGGGDRYVPVANPLR